MTKIAFIGLGNMGSGMAANLVTAGYMVQAYDLSAQASAQAKAAGCQPCATAKIAVQGVAAVVTMLPNGEIVTDLYEKEIFAVAPKSAILIDCSTIDVAAARKLESQAATAGYAMVDSPVSGGITAATQGSLTFMVGGSVPAFHRAEPILQDMGKAVIHAGTAGAGQAAKICNNMLLAIHMIGTCEAFILAEKLGLDQKIFYDIASQASGQCWSMTSYCPLPKIGPDSPADREYQGGFAAALMLKDLNLARSAAQDTGATTFLGHGAWALYKAFVESGHGALDFSAIIQAIAAPPADEESDTDFSTDRK